MTGATVPFVRLWIGWREQLWALPWLFFQAFPVADLVATPRPAAVRAVAGLGLLAFTVAYVGVFRGAFGCRTRLNQALLVVVAVLGTALAAWLGPSWSGLMIYVCAAVAAQLPQRWVWPAVLAAAGVCTGVIAAHGLLAQLFILPVICLLTALALQGTRYLVSVNAELVEARDELARNAVAEERLRFARDLHDLLGHSLSLIALKSELAGKLAERDPVRAREEMADVEAAARRALAEVRDAVSGYRQVSFGQAVVEARSALSAAGITLRGPGTVPHLPGAVDAVLGWVVREATTNVLRHSGARSVTVELVAGERHAVLTVTDDGSGAAGPIGAGLRGLTERVEGAGGRLDVEPMPGRGFRLRAGVPVENPAPAVPERAAAP